MWQVTLCDESRQRWGFSESWEFCRDGALHLLHIPRAYKTSSINRTHNKNVHFGGMGMKAHPLSSSLPFFLS